MFLLICTLLLIKPTANSLYISFIGVENLPYIYIAVAILAFLITSLYGRFTGIYTAKKLFVRTSYISILFLILIAVLMRFQIQTIASVILLYLFMSIFGILSVSQFWILANQIFNAREARKYYGIIGLGAITGGIVGGYLASALSSIWGSESLLYTAIVLISVSVALVHRIKIKRTEVPRMMDSIGFNIIEPFKLVSQSKHLKYLAILLALSVFVAKTIDYQFGYFASINYPDSDDLTAFYGLWYSNFNLVSLLIQLFLTTKIVGRFGVGYSLLILPILLLVNVGLLILIPSLIFALTSKMTEASVKQSINRASMELIMLPIPEDLKLRTKTFIDVFIDSLATGVSGIILIIYIKGLDLNNIYISIIILFAILIWLFYANKMRFEYKSVFRKSLHLHSSKFDIDDQSIIDDYIQVFEKGTVSQITKALKFLDNKSIDGLKPVLINLLSSKSKDVVAATIEMLMYKNSDYSEFIIPLLNHDSHNISILAFEYLINHQGSLKPDYLTNFLNSDNSKHQLTAIAAFAKEFQNDKRTLNVLRIEDRIGIQIQNLDSTGSSYSKRLIAILKSIGYGKFEKYYDFIKTHINNQDRDIRQNAILAAGHTQSKAFIDILVNLLGNQNDPILFRAMAKYNMSTLNSLFTKWKKNNKIELLKKLPYILQDIPQQQSISIIQELLENDNLEIRDSAIKALSHLKDKYPLLIIDENLVQKLLLEEAKYNNTLLQTFSIEMEELNTNDGKKLISLLKEKIDSNLSVIFSLLHIKYPPEEYLEIFDYVNSSDQILRNNAIEYLENSLGSDLKKIIIPLLDINNLERQHKGDNPSIEPEKLKSFLINNRDHDIREASIRYFSNSDQS